MAKFLNTEKIIKEVKNLIDHAEKELVLITPYIDVNELLQNSIGKLEQKGIEVLLICRENILTDAGKKILSSLSNLTIMQHNTVHAKCYFSESRMIITSLNLLEHSYKNNREMGILLIATDDVEEDDEYVNSLGDDETFEDALKEVKEIVKASTIIQRSRNVISRGFDFLFLKDPKLKLAKAVKKINTLYENKIFEISKDKYDAEIIACHNYLENVDVYFDVIIQSYSREDESWQVNRALIELKHPKVQLSKLNSRFKNDLLNLQNTRKFKYYWNHIDTHLSIYPKSREWNEEESSESIIYLFKAEIEYVLSYFKKFNEFKKIY